MGMYAPLAGEDYKFSGLIAAAILDLHPEQAEEGCFVVIRKDEIISLLGALDRQIKAFNLISEEGIMNAQRCYSLSVAAQFAAELIRLVACDKTEDIVFC